MTEYSIQKFLRIHRKTFPLNKKFDLTQFLIDVNNYMDQEYDNLLMRNQGFYLKNRKNFIKNKLSIDLDDIDFTQRSIISRRKENLLKKQKLMLSVCNNKMLLDMMLNNKKYIKYMTERNSENSKTRNKKNIHLKKIGNNINNHLTENSNKKDIYSSIKTYETSDDYNFQKSIYSDESKIMNKTHTKFVSNNSFFKTAIQNEKPRIFHSKTIRNDLFNLAHKNSIKKYNNNSKFPDLNNNHVNFDENKTINSFNKTERNKNLDLTKTCFNYNNTSRKKVIFKGIDLKRNIIEKNNINKFNTKLFSDNKKKSLFFSSANGTKFIKSNILNDQFNTIKALYKKDINIY